LAQSERGLITGIVTDAAGAVVTSAAVRATNMATNAAYNTTTTASGDYTIPTLQPGTYSLRV
jgi:hypothetical protein